MAYILNLRVAARKHLIGRRFKHYEDAEITYTIGQVYGNGDVLITWYEGRESVTYSVTEALLYFINGIWIKL